MTLAFESTLLSDNWTPWLILLLDFAVKGTAIILGAGLLVVLLRRASAATRHLILSLSIVSLLALPGLSLLLPAWQISILSRPPVQSTGDTLVTERDKAAVVASEAKPQQRRSPGRVISESSPMMEEGISPAAASKVGAAELGRRSLDAPQVSFNWSALLLAIWLVGTFGVLVRLLIGTARVWWLARNADPLTDALWTDLAESLSKDLG